MRRILEIFVCVGTVSVALLAGLSLNRPSSHDQMLAGRYHQRQHSVAAFTRSGGNSFRSGKTSYRQHFDQVTPGTTPSQRNQSPSMIARKPGTPVQS